MSVDVEAPQGTKVFVGGLAWETKDEDLREAFEKYGKVEAAEVILHRDTQRSKGFGFVTFESKEDAENAISEMTGQQLQGREIRCDIATGKGSGRREGGGGRGDYNRRSRDGPYERRDYGGGRDYDRRGGRDDRRGGGRRDGGRDYERREGGYDRREGGYDRRDGGYERRERRDYGEKRDYGKSDYNRED